MAMLRRFTLKRGPTGWELVDQEGGVVRTFLSKVEALAGGVLENIVERGTVRIHKEDGSFEEERNCKLARISLAEMKLPHRYGRCPRRRA
jgi:hypothetical protein